MTVSSEDISSLVSQVLDIPRPGFREIPELPTIVPIEGEDGSHGYIGVAAGGNAVVLAPAEVPTACKRRRSERISDKHDTSDGENRCTFDYV